MLVQIYEMQRAYRAKWNGYAGNGLTASCVAPTAFFENLGIIIDSQDRFQYSTVASINHMYCSAIGQLDYSNSDYDEWTINQNGVIQHPCIDLPLEFQRSTEYIWQVVAVDSNQNRIESPVWHFTTTPNALYPSNPIVTPSYPYPNDNFTDKLFTDYFCWYGGVLCDSLSFDFYLGLGYNLQLRKQDLHESIFAPDWYLQKRLMEKLNIILRVQNELKEAEGCYRGNSAIRIPGWYEQFDSTCLWACDFSNEDKYTYTVSATCSTFTVTATMNLDEDASLDTWTVDQTGLIRCLINDADVPYRAHERYSWKIVVHDSHNNVIEGPVWHFITHLDYDMPY